MSKPTMDPENAPIDLVASLRELVTKSRLDPAKLGVAIKSKVPRQIHLKDRHTVAVSDGKDFAEWAVPTLTGLFRGNQAAPPDIDHYPEEYIPYFFFVEKHFVLLCDAMGDRTDQEMEEVYAALRRRPDGRSLGTPHDFMWQVAALLLGKHALSAAQFEGLMSALLGSSRRWALRPVSRFYIAYLRNTLLSATR